MNDIRTKVHEFVHKYLEVSEEDEKTVVDYVLKTWSPPEGRIKYLQFLGGYDTGKTRAGAVMAAVCSKPVVASGASSPAAILWKMDDEYPCTLIVDESELIEAIAEETDEDEEAETNQIVKILSAGSQSDGNIIRMTGSGSDLKPASFNVYGYKVILSRGKFADNAVQSRCIAIELSGLSRNDIPPVLSDEFEQDSEAIQYALLDQFHRL